MKFKNLVIVILVLLFIAKCSVSTDIDVSTRYKYSTNGYFFAHGYFALDSGVYPVAKLIKHTDTNLPAFFVFSDFILTQNNDRLCHSFSSSSGFSVVLDGDKKWIHVPIRSVDTCLFKIPYIKQKNVFILKQNGELHRTDYILTRNTYRRLVAEVYNCETLEDPTNTIYKILHSH